MQPCLSMEMQTEPESRHSPPLDAAGNSVRGQLVTKYLAERLGLNLFASEAATRS